MAISTGLLHMKSLHPDFGVEIGGVDLRQPLDDLWHSDSSFKTVPAQASLLSGRQVPPEGGETEFISCRVAWEALSPEMQRRLERKVAIHSFAYSRGLIWDNRCMLHRGRPWDARRYTRVMHRTTVAGDGPTA